VEFVIKNFEDEILFKSTSLDDLIPLNIEGRLFVDDYEICYVYVFESISIREVLNVIKRKIKNIESRKYDLEKEMKLLSLLETFINL
jgi:hypothetical protein